MESCKNVRLGMGTLYAATCTCVYIYICILTSTLCICNVGNCVDASLLVFFGWTCVHISRCSSSCLYWEWTRRSLRTFRWLERREQSTTQAIELWGNQVQGCSITTTSTAHILLKPKGTGDQNLCPKTPWRHRFFSPATSEAMSWIRWFCRSLAPSWSTNHEFVRTKFKQW